MTPRHALFLSFIVAAAWWPQVSAKAEGAISAEVLSEAGIVPTEGKFHDFKQFKFALPEDGASCIIVSPKIAAAGHPWIWRARFWGHQPAFDKAMLEKGYHIAYCDVANLFGAPKAVQRWDTFYALTQKLGLGAKPVLEGMSRGGLIIFNWAKANPDKVTAIYADNPVCDIRSWPKKKSKPDWKQCLSAYGMAEEEGVEFNGNPTDALEPLAKAGVPVFLVLGAKDDVVPIAENADILERNYKALGGSVRRWVKPNANHHPHGLHPPDELVTAVLAAAK